MLLQDFAKLETPAAETPAAEPAQAAPEAAEPAKAEEAPKSDTSGVSKAAEAAPVAAPEVKKTDPSRVSQLRAKMETERLARQAEISQKERAQAEAEAKALQENPTKALVDKIQALEAKLKEKDAEDQYAKQLSAYEAERKEMKDFVEKSDKYECVKATGNSDLVLNLMIKHYNDTGERLSHDDACSEVEKDLAELAEKLANTSKVKAKFPNTPSTLTNRLAQEVTTRVEVPEKVLLTRDERHAAMLATLLGR